MENSEVLFLLAVSAYTPYWDSRKEKRVDRGTFLLHVLQQYTCSFSRDITLVHARNWLKWFHFINFVEGSLSLIGCMIFMSPFIDVTKMSMLKVSFPAMLHSAQALLVCRMLSFSLWLSLLHNFIQQSLNSDSAQVQTLLAACQRFAMVRISDNGPGWK